MTKNPAQEVAPRLPVGIDRTRLDLVAEFRRQPFGRHSPDLQALLAHMRGSPIVGKYFLLMVSPHSQWMLARFKSGNPLATERLPDHVFDTIEEAEWFVFKMRWKALFGSDLEETL